MERPSIPLKGIAMIRVERGVIERVRDAFMDMDGLNHKGSLLYADGTRCGER